MRVLLLGGTTEAARLARVFHESGIDAVYSLAGRTRSPVSQPIVTRSGGFGGVTGLERYLIEGRFSHVVDATHPFAAKMSANAVEACASAGIPLCALERPKWAAGPGDNWQSVANVAEAVTALPEAPLRVFLAIGKQQPGEFSVKPQHFYLLRMIDPPVGTLPLPLAEAIVGRGPFTVDGDRALMQDHNIDLLVAKNGGSVGARAKIDAARDLGLPVIMIERPYIPVRRSFADERDVLRWLGHDTGRTAERGA